MGTTEEVVASDTALLGFFWNLSPPTVLVFCKNNGRFVRKWYES
jgi:hypothetical protein